MTMLRSLVALLSPRERLYLALLTVAVVIMAFLEMVSVASVLPFLSVAADPGQITASPWLSWAYNSLGFTSQDGFLLGLAAFALLALVVSNTWLAATQWAQIRFAVGRRHSLGVRLLRHYLNQPYVFFLRRNSAELGKNILDETNEIMALIRALLQLTAKGMVGVVITLMLVVYDPVLALILAPALGGAYGVIYFLTRRALSRSGEERVGANRDRYKVATEAFGAIKDIKLLGKEEEFLSRFKGPSVRYKVARSTASLIGEIPRYMLEVLAFGGILIIAIYVIMRGEGLSRAIPVLGLYAFAAYRLMPSLQQVFTSYSKVRFGSPALDNLYRELIETDSSTDKVSPRALATEKGSRSGETIRLARRLELDGVTFTYPGATRPALKDVMLTIDANSMGGIFGPTGSGKTTLVDIILGLLVPDEGVIRIDGIELRPENLRSWQNSVGYVPQHIYLSDDTIARNIAFGIPDAEIDREAVERAARIAQIDEFVSSALPKGYETIVGERGVRLSGGQRQRIGLARALYHDPSVLVFDEATSALDHDTEDQVMEAIEELAGSRTILMIAHRLTTLRQCDLLFQVIDGCVRREKSAVDAETLLIAGEH